jgi:cysE: serine O-acetyltransferase
LRPRLTAIRQRRTRRRSFSPIRGCSPSSYTALPTSCTCGRFPWSPGWWRSTPTAGRVSTSTPARRSGRGSSLTTAQASLSARRRWSAAMWSCIRVWRWAHCPPGRAMPACRESGTPQCATMWLSTPAPPFWAARRWSASTRWWAATRSSPGRWRTTRGWSSRRRRRYSKTRS